MVYKNAIPLTPLIHVITLHYQHFEDTKKVKAHNSIFTQCMSTLYHNQRPRTCTYIHMLPPTHKQLHNYSLTRCVCPEKGAMQEEIQKIIMECKMTNTKKLNTPTVSSLPFHLYLHLAPHTLLCITNILKTLKKCRRTTTHLLNTCQLYTTIRSLAHVHMLPLTHKQLHNYSLTRCVCPGKGAVQEEIQKIIMECKMTNTKKLNTPN